MRNPHGGGTLIDPGARQMVQDSDLVNCIHCGQIGMTKSSTTGKLEILVFRADGTHYMREAGFCLNCYAPTCGRGRCVPCSNRFKRMDEQEAAARKQFICS